MTIPDLFPPPAAVDGPTAAQVVAALRQKRMRVHPERALCDDIESVLAAAGFAYAREHRFSAADRIDFLVGGVGIEVKIRGGTARRDIYRQCLRYCAHDAVSELILATTLPMGLPAMPKPTIILNLSSAWL